MEANGFGVKGGGESDAAYYGRLSGAATGCRSGKRWPTITSIIVKNAILSFTPSSITDNRRTLDLFHLDMCSECKTLRGEARQLRDDGHNLEKGYVRCIASECLGPF